MKSIFAKCALAAAAAAVAGAAQAHPTDAVPVNPYQSIYVRTDGLPQAVAKRVEEEAQKGLRSRWRGTKGSTWSSSPGSSTKSCVGGYPTPVVPPFYSPAPCEPKSWSTMTMAPWWCWIMKVRNIRLKSGPRA